MNRELFEQKYPPPRWVRFDEAAGTYIILGELRGGTATLHDPYLQLWECWKAASQVSGGLIFNQNTKLIVENQRLKLQIEDSVELAEDALHFATQYGRHRKECPERPCVCGYSQVFSALKVKKERLDAFVESCE